MELDDYDICKMEADHILSEASDYLLRLVTCAQIDLNKLARRELRGRLAHQATLDIIAMQRRAP
jgi:hypothetical protein